MNFEDDERVSPKTKIPELFGLADEKKKDFINDLKEAVSIPSISNSPDNSEDVFKMLQFCAQKLEDLGAIVDLVDGNSKETTNLPPVLFANLYVDDEYKTICVYGNIDTLSPEKKENDEYSPFELIEKNGRLYGCGVSDNKAPLLCWFNALKIYKMSKNEIPVNIKFVIEGTSELNSESLSNAIKNKREFFNNVVYICLTVDKRVNEVPCLKYGYRGLCRFTLTVTCGEKKVHSGTFGGAFNQPLMDAVNIIGSLTNKHGKIAVSDFLKDVKPITEIDQKHCIKEVCSQIKSIKEKIGVASFKHKDIPSRIIMHKTLLPSLTVNSFQIISGAADKDDLSSIPNKVKAKFCVRLVNNQKVKRTNVQFHRYIDKQWKHFCSTNSYILNMKVGFDPWQEDPSSNHYIAAAAAIKTVFKVSPNYLCEGTTLPAVSILNVTSPASNIIVMPISGHDDCHHSNCESISIANYIQGIKLIIAYMCELNEINYE